MLGGGLACWDLDGVLEGGVLHPDFVELVDRISVGALWVERSMSGCGLHVFVHAPESRAQVGPHVSFYSFGRFIAVTGDRFK